MLKPEKNDHPNDWVIDDTENLCSYFAALE